MPRPQPALPDGEFVARYIANSLQNHVRSLACSRRDANGFAIVDLVLKSILWKNIGDEYCTGTLGGQITSMFGFSKNNDDLRALNQRLGRFLNSVQYSELDAERQRSEGRIRVAQPCIIFLLQEARSPKSYATGITSDISLHGMSLFTQDAIENGDYILIFGEGEFRVMIQAACKRCVRDSFGFYSVGFQFSKVLRESAYPAIVDAAAQFDFPAVTPTSTSTLAFPQQLSGSMVQG